MQIQTRTASETAMPWICRGYWLTCQGWHSWGSKADTVCSRLFVMIQQESQWNVPPFRKDNLELRKCRQRCRYCWHVHQEQRLQKFRPDLLLLMFPPVASNALLHFFPCRILRMARSKCRMTVLVSTVPSLLSNTLCSNICRTHLLKAAKQCVSAGCSSHVNLAGTNTSQMPHRAHARKKKRTHVCRAGIQNQDRLMGFAISSQCPAPDWNDFTQHLVIHPCALPP